MSAKAASGFGIVQRGMHEVKPLFPTRSNAVHRLETTAAVASILYFR
jgi:hypothetical protein